MVVGRSFSSGSRGKKTNKPRNSSLLFPLTRNPKTTGQDCWQLSKKLNSLHNPATRYHIKRELAEWTRTSSGCAILYPIPLSKLFLEWLQTQNNYANRTTSSVGETMFMLLCSHCSRGWLSKQVTCPKLNGLLTVVQLALMEVLLIWTWNKNSEDSTTKCTKQNSFNQYCKYRKKNT